jgi:hypothetical protein
MPAFFQPEPEKRTEYIPFRVTRTEHALLTALAAMAEVTMTDLVRQGIDRLLESTPPAELAEANRRAQLALGGGSNTPPPSGSKTRPAGSTAKVKATSTKAPSKRTRRSQ